MTTMELREKIERQVAEFIKQLPSNSPLKRCRPKQYANIMVRSLDAIISEKTFWVDVTFFNIDELIVDIKKYLEERGFSLTCPRTAKWDCETTYDVTKI